jgi:hypothetical protein
MEAEAPPAADGFAPHLNEIHDSEALQIFEVPKPASQPATLCSPNFHIF